MGNDDGQTTYVSRLDERVAELKRLELPYAELLARAARAEEWAAYKEYENKNILKVLENIVSQVKKTNRNVSENTPKIKANILATTYDSVKQVANAFDSGIKTQKRSHAKKAAEGRHAGEYETREKIVSHWKQKISPRLSAQKAADEMLGLFRWPNGDEVAHRKLAEIVAQEKRKIRAASSA